MAFSNLTSTSTFTQWFTQTNDMTTFMNEQIVANGQVAYGAFAYGANASIDFFGVVTANINSIDCNTNISLGAPATNAGSYVYVYSDLFKIAANVCLLNPVSSVFVNTTMTVNAVTTFLANVVAADIYAANVFVGKIRVDGNITANNGTLVARQLSLTTNGAAVNSTLSSAGYQDHDFTGLDNAGVWYATPTTNTVLSGLQGHVTATASVDGVRVLYLYNLSDTKKITLSSANTVSTAQHRFETPDNIDVIVPPKGLACLTYNQVSQRWRVLGGTSGSGNYVEPGLSSLGNTMSTGTLSIAGNSTFSANLVAPPLYVNQITGRVGIGTSAPLQLFHSVGPNLLEDVTTASDIRTTKLTATSNTTIANTTFYANGSVVFGNPITVAGISTFNRINASQVYGTQMLGDAFQGVSVTLSGAITAPTGTFTTLGAVNGTTGTFSGAVTVGGKIAPSSDASIALGDATHRFISPFLSVSNGASDAAMALVQASTGEVKQITGYTGSKYIQGTSPDGGGWVYTWKAGILVSVVAAV